MDYQELISILKQTKTVQEIDIHRDEIAELIPKVRIMFGYDQQNSAHQYNLWEHCLHTVLGLPKGIDDDVLYLAALLHDIGKPDCQCKGKREDDTNMHYYGHPIKSMEIVRDEVIPYLETIGAMLSETDKKRLLYYVENHDYRMSYREKHLNKLLKMASLDEFKKLMLLEIADAKAHVMLPVVQERIKICEEWYKRVCDIE